MDPLKTKNDYLEAHADLWLWMAENPLEDKESWPGWIENNGIYEMQPNDCFACGWAILSVSSEDYFDCDFCLLDWGIPGVYCECARRNSIYFKFLTQQFRYIDKHGMQYGKDSSIISMLTDLAVAIAALPERTD